MIVCADDYGLREDIDDAILDLCSVGKLSAVSCMLALQRCDGDALARLLKHESHVDVGLHLCLTNEEPPLSFSEPFARHEPPCFGALVRRAVFGRVRPDEVFRQVAIQYDLFVEKSGRTPSHIDGHLHTHQLPGVRRGLLDFVLTLPPDRRPYIRNTHQPIRQVRRHDLPFRKAGLIGLFGAHLKKNLRAAGVPTNEGFAGIYDFRQYRRFPELLPRFVASLPDPNGILVVHPGRQEAWRNCEYTTLRTLSLDAPLNRFQTHPRSG